MTTITVIDHGMSLSVLQTGCLSHISKYVRGQSVKNSTFIATIYLKGLLMRKDTLRKSSIGFSIRFILIEFQILFEYTILHYILPTPLFRREFRRKRFFY
jgi:hypothetical protein